MAGIDISSAGRGRATNHELPLIPFIDFLLCLVMFLLVTAVWSTMARLEADAMVPGKGDVPEEREVALHVEVRGEHVFRLSWRQGETVLATEDVARKTTGSGNDVSYPELATAIQRHWEKHGVHRAVDDQRMDRAVLHTDNSLQFGEVSAVLDAIAATRKKESADPAFAVAFATE